MDMRVNKLLVRSFISVTVIEKKICCAAMPVVESLGSAVIPHARPHLVSDYNTVVKTGQQNR